MDTKIISELEEKIGNEIVGKIKATTCIFTGISSVLGGYIYSKLNDGNTTTENIVPVAIGVVIGIVIGYYGGRIVSSYIFQKKYPNKANNISEWEKLTDPMQILYVDNERT